MSMWYNLSSINGNTGVLGLAQGIDSLFFFHLFGFFILITLFVIIFKSYVSYNNSPKVSMMYSAFFIAVLSIIFKLLTLVGDQIVFICWGVFAITIALQFLMD